MPCHLQWHEVLNLTWGGMAWHAQKRCSWFDVGWHGMAWHAQKRCSWFDVACMPACHGMHAICGKWWHLPLTHPPSTSLFKESNTYIGFPLVNLLTIYLEICVSMSIHSHTNSPTQHPTIQRVEKHWISLGNFAYNFLRDLCEYEHPFSH